MNIAVITGASSGMGKQFALALAGDRKIKGLWLMGRDEKRLTETKKMIQNLFPDKKVTTFSYDFCTGDRHMLRAYIQQILDMETKTGKLRITHLVNAAGFGIIGAFSSGAYEDETDMVYLNSYVLTAVTKLFLPYMIKGGKIFMLASSAAFLPQPDFAVYAASKSYVYHFSKALNAELRDRNITVTAVCPGPVDTPFFERAETGKKRAWYKNIFMADPERVVQKALQDNRRGRDISVYGAAMNLFRIATKVIPDSIILRLFF